MAGFLAMSREKWVPPRVSRPKIKLMRLDGPLGHNDGNKMVLGGGIFTRLLVLLDKFQRVWISIFEKVVSTMRT